MMAEQNQQSTENIRTPNTQQSTENPKQCRQCLLRDMQGTQAEYYESVLRYRKTLSEKQGVSDEVYERRLASCVACSALVSGTCAHCGCYVEMRAAKKRMSCPSPDGNRWLE